MLIMIKALILISSLFLFSIGQMKTVDTTIMKKIERRVKKLTGSKDIKLEAFQNRIPTSDKSLEEVETYQIFIDNSKWGLAYVTKAEACHFGGCADPNLIDKSSNLSRDCIKYFVITNLADTIIDIQIIDFESSYGYEITSRAWLKQFIDKRPGEFSLEENIDVISGATISCNSMVESINALSPGH